MPFIAELAFHLLLNVIIYSVGRFAIMAFSFGHVRPKRLADIWHAGTCRDRAMGIYLEMAVVDLVGMGVLAAIAALCIFLYQ
jgi:hypothetical protein